MKDFDLKFNRFNGFNVKRVKPTVASNLIYRRDTSMKYYPGGHRFVLDKNYKTTCPNCGRETYSLYIDQEYGIPVDRLVGKCSHTKHCGEHITPREYFALNPDYLNLDDVDLSNIDFSKISIYEVMNNLDIMNSEMVFDYIWNLEKQYPNKKKKDKMQPDAELPF